MGRELHSLVTGQIGDLADLTDEFHTHALYYDTISAEHAETEILERSRRKTVDSWIAVEQQRKQLDLLIDELGIAADVSYTDIDTGETHTDTAAVNSLQDLLYCTTLEQFSDTDAAAIAARSRYDTDEAEQVVSAFQDEYSALADTNKLYLEALNALVPHDDVTRRKRSDAEFGDTPPEKAYRQIEDVLLQREDEASAAL